MRLRTLNGFDLTGKTVLYRSPYDINVIQKDGELVLVDDSRIKASLPTLKYLLSQNCKIVILTYVGRPDGMVVDDLRTIPHAKRLSEILGQPVPQLMDCVGDDVRNYISTMSPASLVMLENTRFHIGEVEDDDTFAQELAKNGEVVVFDGFPQAHRAHASVTGILRHLPSVAGYYMEKEVQGLSGLLDNPMRPFTVIIGGAKVSDKVAAIQNLWNSADIFLVGGGVANVFLKARGKEMGKSFIEDVYVDAKKGEKKDWVELAGQIQTTPTESVSYLQFKIDETINVHKVLHPYDVVIADSFENPKDYRVSVAYEQKDVVPAEWVALDIGPKAREIFSTIISQSRTIFWNGPMGKVEDPRFALGSAAIAKAMAASEAFTVVAGGDTIAVVDQYADASAFSLLSLAGGATLEFLSGKKLPAVEMLLA